MTGKLFGLICATILVAKTSAVADVFLYWDSQTKVTNIIASANEAHFTFNFTNASLTNVTILSVHPSCGCTTAQLPPLPWTIPSGTNGQIGITVNLAGKNGVVSKYVTVITDEGMKTLYVNITILQPNISLAIPDAERAQNMKLAAVDRQTVFKGDCASCHVKPAEGKYGKELFDAACGICHEGEHRATMVPDLHHLKDPTSEEFWRALITAGKPNTLMPAFAISQGGPLSDLQINSLTTYLNVTIPSQAGQPETRH